MTVAKTVGVGVRRRLCILAVIMGGVVSLVGSVGVSSAFAAFGFAPETVDALLLDEFGDAFSQAGGHPFSAGTEFRLNTTVDSNPEDVNFKLPIPEESQLRNVKVTLPPGLIADVTATPRCTLSELAAANAESEIAPPECPDGAQVGMADTWMDLFKIYGDYRVPIYNLVPEPGQPALFGFKLGFVVVIAVPRLRTSDYGFDFDVVDINESTPVVASKFVFWGVPASHAHDSERPHPVPAGSSNGAPKPFVTLPVDCLHGPFVVTTEAQAWEGQSASVQSVTHDTEGNPLGVTRCDRVPFEPSVKAAPTTANAEAPTGLDFELSIPVAGIKNATGVAQSELKGAVVSLPEGFTLNPSAGEGLGYCSPADYAREELKTVPGAGCPNKSKLGTVRIDSPLLPSGEILEGSVFLAQPDDPATASPGAENPFDSLLAIYIVARLPERGVIIKTAGKIENDPVTGQITTVFDGLPQLPFGTFKLHFREGARAALASAPTCGSYNTSALLTPWSAPGEAAPVTSTSLLTAGVGGGECPSGGVPPFKPGLVGGTLNNAAGQYSPVDVRVVREDGEQEITGFASLLPRGVTANLSGVPFCSDAQIATARVKSGAAEEASSSCPAASQIGRSLVGVGVGSVLAHTPGKLFMAGPFEGAPFSVVSVTSAKVGPFDLGTVVVRLPLNIDPVTAQVSIPAGAADQIPHIIRGIVVHVRDIRVYVDRPNFTLNPTNCEPLSLTETVYGAGRDPANPADDVPSTVTDRFQAANCANLAFKPLFKAFTSGKTSRKSGASLKVTLAYPKAPFGSQANIRSVKVDLPKQLPSRLSTLQQACTDKQFRANPAACPSPSRVGIAKAITPILPVPIEGPAYFVSHGGAKFPELIVVLQGYGITIDLYGGTFISKTGVTSSTFRTVPDQPVTSFELTLPQGKYSALAANGNLCTTKLTMPTTFTAQNGTTIKQNTHITTTNCPKHKPKHKTKHKARR